MDRETINRYKEYCRYLTVIYMRGRRGVIKDEVIDKNIRLVSVHLFIKQLPKHRQAYYLNLIHKILMRLDSFESWVK